MTHLTTILTNYNHGAYLTETIASIAEQSHPPDEIIVIDDASTDNSLDVLAELSQKYPHIRLICRQQNCGVVAGLQTGFEAAAQGYLHFIGADDPLKPGFYALAFQMLEQYPQAGFCCAEYSFLFPNGDLLDSPINIAPGPRYFSPSELAKEYFQRWQLSLPTTPALWRTEAIRDAGIIDALKWHVDWFFAVVIAFRYGCCYIPGSYQFIRHDPHSFSRNGIQSRNAEYNELLRELLKLLSAPRYSDVRIFFKIPSILSRFGFRGLRQIIDDEKNHDLLSLELIDYASIAEGYNAQDYLEKGRRLTPEELVVFCRQYLEEYEKSLVVLDTNSVTDCAAATKPDREKGLMCPTDTLEIYLQAIENTPRSSDCYRNLAEYYRRHNKTCEASASYIKALELSPAEPELLQAVNLFLRSAGRNKETELLFLLYDEICKKLPERPGKRLLAVYDLAVQPYSIGDLLTFLMGSLAASKLYGLNGIDLCFVGDINRIPLEPVFANMNADGNRLYNIFTLLPLVQLNHAVGSVMIMDSFSKTIRFIQENQEFYEVWPTQSQLLSNTYNYFEIMQLVDKLHRTAGTWPLLSTSGAITEWVISFFRTHAKDKLPVSINLRNNPHFHLDRNSDMLAWVAFFKRCYNRFPVQFIVVCSQSEVTPELRSCPNVTVVKDQNTSIVQDVALVMSSAFHMGSSSGPSIIPRCSDKPYVIFDAGDISPLLSGYGTVFVHESEQVARFSFSHPFQRTILVRENLDLLLLEFNRIWNLRDWNLWQIAIPSNLPADGGRSSLGWLH